MSSDPSDDGLTVGDLGPGWEQVDRALADVQADLTRTVPDAPALVLLWRELDGRDASDEMAAHHLGADARWAYVGKSRHWYHGSRGGFALNHDYPSAVLDIAEQVSEAVTAGLLDTLTYWPPCPFDGRLLEVVTDVRGRCWWACINGRHIVAEVGHLPGPEQSR